MRIKTLLIANRGEIACRIIRTARAMGIKTVAVYSDADRDAPHVRAADTAFHIGPAEAALSYLDAARIIEAAKKAGADAVHPGYGFLSENADFAAGCAAAGLRFVGPSADVIRLMGSKIEAKTQAAAAGVPVVPGYNGADQSDETLIVQSEKIGFPMLIKASAGGGGRGMRVVEDPSALHDALTAARAEAQAGFGDSALLLERYVETARHIEVQILGDAHGNVVHLFERDCSLQRNHQKVIEEAPAPNLPESLREAILISAVTLAKTVGYQSAGTVEYLLDEARGEFYFLEVNTRLQVEHPVTEAVTGIDLVEWQLRIVAGEPLGFAQQDISCHGWAIEARIAAEDPSEGYRPETGKITSFLSPPDCRTDSGVVAGSFVSHHYDSMLAKVISHASDRASAIARLSVGLTKMHIGGLTTNIAFLNDLLRSDPFADGAHSTGTITALYPDGWQPPAATPELRAIAVLARYLADCPNGRTPWNSLGAWRSVSVGGRHGGAVYHLGEITAEICEIPDGLRVQVAGEPRHDFINFRALSGRLTFERCGQRHDVGVAYEGDEILISDEHGRISITVQNGEEAFLARSRNVGNSIREIRAPMPGLVADVLVAAGANVKAGDPVIVIEAMKLLQTINAPCDGGLSAVHYSAGDTVEKNALLVTFSPKETPQ